MVERRSSNTQKNLAGLLFCSLLIVSICLTAFNLYLFAWIWSNFGGAQPLGFARDTPNERHASLLAQINLAPDANVIRFNSKLISDKELTLAHVTGTSDTLWLTSRSGGDIQLAHGLQLSAAEGRLDFPAGLVARGRNSTARPFATCSPSGSGSPFCSLSAPKLKLTGPRVSLANKSLHLNLVREVRRLHSPLNRLEMLSAGGISLRAKQLDMQALESISLRGSKVIMEAKTIDVSARLIETRQWQRAPGRHQHQVCVCLQAQPPVVELRSGAGPSERLGRLFAVAAGLKCAQFSDTFCNSPPALDSSAAHPNTT